MEKHQFKLFDQVLVRDSHLGKWRANFYSHLDAHNNHVCVSGTWSFCIPYNEETKHLIDTNNDYKTPEPKEYHVWTSGSFNEWMTENEFQNFITTAVIHNKDITDFHVLRIKP